MFRIALCDDDAVFLKQEREMTEKFLRSKDIHFEISEFSSGQAMIDENKIESYDLILLDFEMVGMDGFETAKRIREKSEKTSIAFVTVFFEFAREGYRFDALRYLVKQESTFEKELQDCIQKAIRVKENRRKNTRVFDFVEGPLTVDFENLIYVLSDKHYLDFHVLDGENIRIYKMRAKLAQIQAELDETHMFALARTGQILNLKYVKVVDRKGTIAIQVNNKTLSIIKLPESRKAEFMSAYLRYYGG